jgi:hypothetical protein
MILNYLNKVSNLGQYTRLLNDMTLYDKNNIDWWWPRFINTLLAKHYLQNNKKLYASPLEGLMFSYKGCNNIVNFLKTNEDIKSDLFNFEAPVQEFSFQTICANCEEPYYYIGNGVCEDPIGINTDTEIKFMYKVKRI